MIKRRADWTVRLQACVLEWSDVPFEYGKNDCVLWASAAVEAMTGFDIAGDIRGYATEEEGLVMAKERGVADQIDLFARVLPRADRIRVGDVGVIERSGTQAMGIAGHRGFYVMLPDRGLAIVPRSWAKFGMTV